MVPYQSVEELAILVATKSGEKIRLGSLRY
jgi:hypothetical protein